MRYTDPSNDEKVQDVDECEREREETAIATQRLYNQAYLQRRRSSLVFTITHNAGKRGCIALRRPGSAQVRFARVELPSLEAGVRKPTRTPIACVHGVDRRFSPKAVAVSAPKSSSW